PAASRRHAQEEAHASLAQSAQEAQGHEGAGGHQEAGRHREALWRWWRRRRCRWRLRRRSGVLMRFGDLLREDAMFDAGERRAATTAFDAILNFVQDHADRLDEV